MISIFLIVLGIIIALVQFFSARSSETGFRKRKYFLPLATIFIFIVLAIVNPFTVERVDAGHVGIKVNLTGDDRGVSKFEYKTGWVVFNTWVSTLYEFPTFQQHIDYPEQSVITKGGFEATIKPSFNYSLNPGTIGEMFQNLRLPVKQVEQGWLKNAIMKASQRMVECLREKKGACCPGADSWRMPS